MDTTTRISDLAESQRHDQFIPVRKEDLFSALIKQGDLADTTERELFRRFARTLRTICHYEYSETLDRLRDDYYYFNPEVAGHTAADRVKSDYAYDDLIRSLDKVLKDAKFEDALNDVAITKLQAAPSAASRGTLLDARKPAWRPSGLLFPVDHGLLR